MEFLRTLESVRCNDVVTQTLIRAGRHSPHTYPFGNPVSMEQSHVVIVKSLPYWITEKTDGTRVCLIFTLSHAGAAHALLMDRVGNLYGFPVSCEAELFQGSVFDCELVYDDDTGQGSIYVFDVAMLEGEVLNGEPLSARLALIEDVVGAISCLAPRLELYSKKMYRMEDVLLFLKEMKDSETTAARRADGFILTPEEQAAPLPGTAWSVFKIKPMHTIDLMCVNREVWYGAGEELLRMDAFPGVEAVTIDTADLCCKDGSIIECTAELSLSSDGTKTLLRLRKKCDRPDKTVPNNALCIARTLVSIRDSISIESILPALPMQPAVAAAAAAAAAAAL